MDQSLSLINQKQAFSLSVALASVHCLWADFSVKIANFTQFDSTILHLKLLAQKFLLVCGGDWTLFYFYFSNFTLQWQKVWKIMDFFLSFVYIREKKELQNGKKNIAKLSKAQYFKNETLVETLLAFKNIL